MRCLIDSIPIEVPWIGIVAGILGKLLRIEKWVQAAIECFVIHSRRAVEEGKANEDRFNAMLSRHFSQSTRVLSLQGVVQCVPRGRFMPCAAILSIISLEPATSLSTGTTASRSTSFLLGK